MALQMATMAQVTSTMEGLVSQRMFWPRMLLMMPYSVLKIHFHTMATAAGATTMGRKKMARKAVRPLSLAFSRTATSSARNTPTGTVRMQK